MSTNLPARNLPAIEWLEARISGWMTDFAAIGVSSAAVFNLDSEITDARDAFTVTQTIRAQSKSKTTEFYTKSKTMHDDAANIVSAIKSYADAQTDPAAVYAIANVSQNDPATPAGAPDAPTNVQATVLNGGNVHVEWDGSLAQRTFFEVLRRVDGAAEWSRIGSLGEKEFTDTSVPTNSYLVQYVVRAVRGADVSANGGPAVVQIGATPVDEEGELPIAA